MVGYSKLLSSVFPMSFLDSSIQRDIVFSISQLMTHQLIELDVIDQSDNWNQSNLKAIDVIH